MIKVSVIIATYNWSNALALSLQSAINQTMTDIEIIVVGDACTDNSENIVKAFPDKRIRWFNLSTNSGSQALPNNKGIQEASGEFIAYLGHDDLWHPTHLETLLKTQQQTNADYIFSGAILYGPPDTLIRATTGMLPNNIPQRTDFAPPTTVMHKTDLITRIGEWKQNHEVTYPIDYEFQSRAWDAKARFACTGRITAFKFPAAWWRDSYKKKDVTRQQQLFYQIQHNPHLIEDELRQVEHAKALEQFQIVGAPQQREKGEYFAINSLIKGTRELVQTISNTSTQIIFTQNVPCFAFEWYEYEFAGNEMFRWTGPRTESTLDIPFNTETKNMLDMTIHIVHAIQNDVLLGLTLLINNHVVPFKIMQETTIGWMLSCRLTKDVVGSGIKNNIRITFQLPYVLSPYSLDKNSPDKRLLGIAVGNIEIQMVEPQKKRLPLLFSLLKRYTHSPV